MQVQIGVGKYNVSVPTGSYDKDGETKNTYSTIGTIFVKEDGKMSMKFNPLVENYLKLLLGSGFTGRANVFYEKKEAAKTTEATRDEDLPF